jgi:hypothetical protein
MDRYLSSLWVSTSSVERDPKLVRATLRRW